MRCRVCQHDDEHTNPCLPCLDRIIEKMEQVRNFLDPGIVNQVIDVTVAVCVAERQSNASSTPPQECPLHTCSMNPSGNLGVYCKPCQGEIYKRMVHNLYKRKDIKHMKELPFEEQVVSAATMYGAYHQLSRKNSRDKRPVDPV